MDFKDIAVEEMPEEQQAQPIGIQQIRKAKETLKKYKDGRAHLTDKIKRNEQWWKMRHWDIIREKNYAHDPKPASGWLFNVITSKHADFMDSFPTPDILPREEGDEPEAKALSSIIPVVLEQNKFEGVYSDEVWYKLKNGTGVYGVFWDPSKLNGLGDISVKSLDLLSLYWEPGVTDIQNSQNFFSVELVDIAILKDMYPEHAKEFSADTDRELINQYIYDDHISTDNKCLVVDWYYKKTVNGKKVLHYCKFVDDIVLYATENDTNSPMAEQSEPIYDENGEIMTDAAGVPETIEMQVPISRPTSERGWYDHGKYPFVFDVLFKEEGLPTGFGFVDVCKNPQISIDLMNNAFEKNLLMNVNPRYFERMDGAINKEQFTDPNQMVVDVDGNLGDDSIRPIPGNQLTGNYITVMQDKVEELKETAGNRDVSTGGTTSGATAASAIAAMQESAGKTSRDMIKTSYRAYEEVVTMVIELIRQFYDMPRQFRIIGDKGQQEYTVYDNRGLQPSHQGIDFGVDQGYRLPVFDIKVKAEKENRYSQLAHNEMALQFYNSGFFNPEYADQVLACIDMMEFEGKEKVREKVEQNGGMFRQMIQMQQQMLQMAQMIDGLTAQAGEPTNLSEQLATGIMGQPTMQQANKANTDVMAGYQKGEHKRVANARQAAAATTTPR